MGNTNEEVSPLLNNNWCPTFLSETFTRSEKFSLVVHEVNKIIIVNRDNPILDIIKLKLLLILSTNILLFNCFKQELTFLLHFFDIFYLSSLRPEGKHLLSFRLQGEISLIKVTHNLKISQSLIKSLIRNDKEKRHYEGGTTEVICLSQTTNTKIASLSLAMTLIVIPTYRRENTHCHFELKCYGDEKSYQ